MAARLILVLVYCGSCGNIQQCIQNQCSAIASRHVFLELYEGIFKTLGLSRFRNCLYMLWTTMFNFLWLFGPFWFWFIVGVAEMRWPACPTLCIVAVLQFIAQIWQLRNVHYVSVLYWRLCGIYHRYTIYKCVEKTCIKLPTQQLMLYMHNVHNILRCFDNWYLIFIRSI